MSRGFSLVELSIVLVILGLLVGGVLSGQALIRASELRHATAQIDEYQTALRTFQDKYFFLPGDIPNAKSFWSACIDSGSSTLVGGIAYYTYPCNGDGNGHIGATTAGAASLENVMVFEHLSLAGLVAGQYDVSIGTKDAMFPKFITGYLKIGPYGVMAGFYPDGFTGESFFASQGDSPRVKADEVYSLDIKLDDGNALSGKFRVSPEELPTPGCMDPATGVYLPANVADYCTFLITL